MILFAGNTPEKILSGEKTQTRRCWKRSFIKPGSFHWAQRNYRKESRFALLEILDVWEQSPWDISDEHAKAEGFEHRWQFISAYYDQYPNCDIDVEDGKRHHYVIDFRVEKVVNNEQKI